MRKRSAKQPLLKVRLLRPLETPSFDAGCYKFERRDGEWHCVTPRAPKTSRRFTRRKEK